MRSPLETGTRRVFRATDAPSTVQPQVLVPEPPPDRRSGASSTVRSALQTRPSTDDRAAVHRPRCRPGARRGGQPPVKRERLRVRTGSRRGVFDLTGACERFVAGEGDGLLSVFVPHATAGVVIMELGAGSDADLEAALDRLLPRDDRYRHRHGSPGHGADHVLPLLVPPSITVPVVDGRLALGTWQSITLLDPNADNEERTVLLGFLRG
jgi:secondary thiamine-phosphate synthase enzyme